MATEDQATIDADALAQLDAAEDKGWEDAAGAFIAEKGAALPVETPKVDDTKTEKTDEEKQAEKDAADAAEAKRVEDEEAEKAKGETPEQTEARHKKEAEEAEAKKQVPADPNATKVIRDQRALQREIAADREQTLTDVKTKVFEGVQTRLEDAEGNAITTIEQLTELKNTRTGKAFTEEEAAQYLLDAAKHFQKVREDTEAKAEKIADFNITLKDDIDDVKVAYKEVLENVPGLGKKLWDQYKKLITIDEERELMEGASMSFREFADMQLAPYMAQLEKIDAEETQAKKDADAALEAKKLKAKEDKEKARKDRSDVFGGGKTDLGTDKLEDDWAKAAKEYYEG